MFRSIACLMIVFTGAAFGAVKHLPIRSGVVLKPGEVTTVQLASQKPVEIGWTAVQATPCVTDCIQMTLLSGTYHQPFSAALGATGNYTPADGKVIVEYKNLSQQSVTINIFRLERSCDAESCKLFASSQKGRWLVYKVGEFRSITNSSDGSYSVITGVAQSGRAFRVRVVWWTDEKGAGFMGCPRFIKGYVESHAPKERYSPYIISGQALGEGNEIVLKSIDTCVPLAPYFGVPEQNVFK